MRADTTPRLTPETTRTDGGAYAYLPLVSSLQEDLTLGEKTVLVCGQHRRLRERHTLFGTSSSEPFSIAYKTHLAEPHTHLARYQGTFRLQNEKDVLREYVQRLEVALTFCDNETGSLHQLTKFV